MKIIAFGASNSKQSINQQLAVYAANTIKDATIIELDLNDFEVPIYSIDREKDTGIPALIQEFVQLLADADGLIVSLAEHNGAYTVAFKNIIDWASRYELGFFGDKPVLLMATSPGGYGAKNVLQLAEQRLPKFKANISATFSLPFFKENFNANEGVTQEELRDELMGKIALFKNAIK
jgi:chromate reductase